MLAFYGQCGGRNKVPGGDHWTLDGRPLPYHMPTPGIEPGPLWWQSRVLALCFPGSGSFILQTIKWVFDGN